MTSSEQKMLLIPFTLQAIAMAVDEGYFHRKRGLPKWERIGHPVDTLSVIFALCIPRFIAPGANALLAYSIASIGSCILITKDEWIHKKYCPATENWLHSVLFILHPICLMSAGKLWISEVSWAKGFLSGELLLLILASLFQIIYWSWVWERKKDPLKTPSTIN